MKKCVHIAVVLGVFGLVGCVRVPPAAVRSHFSGRVKIAPNASGRVAPASIASRPLPLSSQTHSGYNASGRVAPAPIAGPARGSGHSRPGSGNWVDLADKGMNLMDLFTDDDNRRGWR